MKLNLTKKIVLSLLGALFSAHMHAAEVKVAVAANFAKTLEEITAYVKLPDKTVAKDLDVKI